MFEAVPRSIWPALRHELWRYDVTDPLAVGYSFLNVGEALAWFAIAGWVARRAWRDPRTRWELAYASALLVFGISDVWESYQVPVWLIPTKGLIFAMILLLRIPVKRARPGLKL